MPIAKVRMPNGRIARFSVPEGTTPERVVAFAKEHLDRQEVGIGAGLLEAAEQGVTFGFNDEASAAINALWRKITHPDSDFTDTYKANLSNYRGRLDQFKEKHPNLALGAEIGGSMALPVGAGARAARASDSVLSSLAPRTLASAAGGAAYGFGSADGDLSDRVRSAAQGGAIGAVVPPALAAGGAAVRAATTGATRRAEQKVADALINDNVDPAALPAQIARNAAADQVEGSRYSDLLPDYAGDATRRLLRGVRSRSATASGQIDDALQARYGGALASRPFTDLPEDQAGRISNTLNRTLGMTNDAQATLHALTERMRVQGEPHYQAAYAATPRITAKPLYDILTQTKAGRQAYAAARRTAENEGRSLPASLVRPDGGYIPVSLRDMDLAKRALDDVAYVSKRKGSAGRTEQGSQKGLARRFTDLLRQAASPEYGRALDTFSTGYRLRDAMESGQGVLAKDARTVRRELSDLNPAEQRAYQVGAYDALRKIIEGAGDNTDLVKRLVGSPSMRAKLKLVIGDQAEIDALASRAQREAKQTLTKQRVQGGSNTADKLNDASGTVAAINQALNSARYSVAPMSSLLYQGAIGLNRATIGRMTRNTDDQLARILMTPDEQAQIELAKRIQRQTDATARRRRLEAAGQLGASAAAVTGLLNQ